MLTLLFDASLEKVHRHVSIVGSVQRIINFLVLKLNFWALNPLPLPGEAVEPKVDVKGGEKAPADPGSSFEPKHLRLAPPSVSLEASKRRRPHTSAAAAAAEKKRLVSPSDVIKAAGGVALVR